MLRHMLRPKEDCILVDASSISDYSNTWHLTLQAIRDAVADHRGDIDTYTARQDDGVF